MLLTRNFIVSSEPVQLHKHISTYCRFVNNPSGYQDYSRMSLVAIPDIATAYDRNKFLAEASGQGQLMKERK